MESEGYGRKMEEEVDVCGYIYMGVGFMHVLIGQVTKHSKRNTDHFIDLTFFFQLAS
jgi:hypothetical protein